MNETILLVRDDSGQLVDSLVSLAANRMVRPFLVVTDDGAERISAAGRHRVVLRDELAQRQLDLVRLVAVHAQDATPSPDRRWFEQQLCDELALLARQSGTGFVSGVIAQGAHAAPVPQAAFHGSWTFNVILVPEDGAGEPQFLPRPLQRADRVGAAVAAVGLIGGLWVWLNEGVLDQARYPNQPSLWLQPARCFTRIVDGGDVSRSLIEAALDTHGSWPIPPGFVRHDDPVAAVTLLARELANHPCVNFRYNPPDSLPGAMHVPWRSAVRLFAAGVGSYATSRPRVWTDMLIAWVKHRFTGVLQDATFGKQSEIRVAIGDSTDAAVAKGSPAPHRDRRGVSVLPPPVPETWRKLAAVIVASADGGALQPDVEDLRPRWNGEPAIVDDPFHLAPLPPGREGSQQADVRFVVGTSLTERLSERIGKATAEAERHVEALEHDAAEVAKQINAETTRILERQRHLQRLVAAAIAAFVAVVGFGAAAVTVEARRWVLVRLSIISFATLVGLIRKVVGIGVEQVRREFSLRHLSAKPDLIAAQVWHAIAEQGRLAQLAVQFPDWADILGAVLHRPWPTGNMEDDNLPMWRPAPLLQFSVAQAHTHDRGLQSAALDLRQQVARAGWITRVLDDLRADWSGRYAVLGHGLTGSDVEPESDRSKADLALRPRRNLRDDVVAGVGWPAVRAELVHQLAASLSVQDPDRFIGRVECAVSALNGRGVRHFLSPIVLCDPSPFDRRYFDVISTTGTDVAEQVIGMLNAVDPVFEPARPGLRRIVVTQPDDRYVAAAFRFDLGRLHEPHELTLVAPDQAAPVAVGAIALATTLATSVADEHERG